MSSTFCIILTRRIFSYRCIVKFHFINSISRSIHTIAYSRRMRVHKFSYTVDRPYHRIDHVAKYTRINLQRLSQRRISALETSVLLPAVSAIYYSFLAEWSILVNQTSSVHSVWPRYCNCAGTKIILPNSAINLAIGDIYIHTCIKTWIAKTIKIGDFNLKRLLEKSTIHNKKYQSRSDQINILLYI